MTTDTSLLDLTGAMYTALLANSAFMALVTGVWNGNAPENQPFPYVAAGTKTEVPWRGFGTSAKDMDVLIVWDIWTTGQSDEEAVAILAAMNKVLDPIRLEGDDYSCLIRYDWSTTLYEQDTGVYHIPARYHAKNSVKVA